MDVFVIINDFFINLCRCQHTYSILWRFYLLLCMVLNWEESSQSVGRSSLFCCVGGEKNRDNARCDCQTRQSDSHPLCKTQHATMLLCIQVYFLRLWVYKLVWFALCRKKEAWHQNCHDVKYWNKGRHSTFTWVHFGLSWTFYSSSTTFQTEILYFLLLLHLSGGCSYCLLYRFTFYIRHNVECC